MEKLFIRIPITDSAPVGPGKTQLLELVAETGSIRAAAIKMGLSYRRAWMLLAEMEKSFGAPVLARQTGGKRGGGARPAAHLPAAKVDHLHGTACVMRPEVQELLGTHVSGAGSRALSGSTEQPSLQLRASVDHLAGAAPCRLHTAQAQRELH